MAAESCAEDRPSLDEASKRWRVKRRRPPTNLSSVSEPRCLGPPCTQTRPWPSRITPAAWGANADAVAANNEDFKSVGYCPRSKKQRGSAEDRAVPQRADEGCERGVMGGEFVAAAAGKRSERSRRRYLSKNTLIGMSSSSVPKLVMLPQEVSWSLTDDCRSGGAVAPCCVENMEPRSARMPCSHAGGMGGLRVSPQRHDTAAPSRRTSASGEKMACRNGSNSTNRNDSSQSLHEIRLDGGECSRRKNNSTPNTAPDTCAAVGNHIIKDIGNHGVGIIKGSNWQQCQGAHANALVPQVPLTEDFTSTMTAATIIPTAKPRHIQVMRSCVDECQGLQVTQEKVGQTQSSMTRESAVKTPTRERVRPHTVSSGLREVGSPWEDLHERRGQQATFDSLSSASRPYSTDASGHAATPAAVLPQDARLNAIIQSDDVVPSSSKGGGISARHRYQHGSPRIGDRGKRSTPTKAKSPLGLTAEALGSPGIALDRLGRAALIEKFMIAFKEIWPADLPNLRPLRLNLRRSCGAVPAGPGVDSTDRNTSGDIDHCGDDGGENFGGPVFLMPMHRKGKGVEGREAMLFAEPPRLRREGEKMAKNRDRYCFRDENRYGKTFAVKDSSKNGDGGGSACSRRKWARCKLSETGIETWRWVWSPEAGMMLGKLALWKGALLISRTQTVLTVFGLGMAGRVVVEGAPFPRGLLVEAYVPASCETCELFLSVEDLKLLFLKDPENMSVGKKGDMVLELVKMLYFDYTLETEAADASPPGGVRLKSCHYSDREPWTCLLSRRNSDFDLHWERRKSTYESEGEPSTGAGLSSGARSTTMTCVPDERAVWVIQHLRVRSTQNLVDADIEAIPRGSGSDGCRGNDEYGDSGGIGSTPTTAIHERPATPSNENSALNSRRAGILLSPSAMRTRRRKMRDQGPTRGATKVTGPVKAGTKVRVKAFVIRAEQYKEERQHAEEAQEAKLQAWLAIKKRFRGLTLGTVVRVSGRLLTLMVYEFPDQPGSLQVCFTNPRSGEKFRVSLGFRLVSVFARRYLSVTSSPEDWTLRQRRRIIKRAVQDTSTLVVTDGEDAGEISHPNAGSAGWITGVGDEACPRRLSTIMPSCGGDKGIDMRCPASGRGLYRAVRCLGRATTAARTREAPTASRGFTRRRNDYQLQQPCPKDHRRGSLRVRLPAGQLYVKSATPAPSAASDPPNEVALLVGSGATSAASGKLQTASGQGVFDNGATDDCGPGVPLLRLHPRRECGRGRRLCGGIAQVGNERGIFSLLRGNWVGSEENFLLDWYHQSGFRPDGHGPVEPHTTYTLELLAQDLHLVVEGTGLMIVAQESSKRVCARGGHDRSCDSHNGAVDSNRSAIGVATGTLRGGATSRPEIPPRTAVLDQRFPERKSSASLVRPPGERGSGEGCVFEQDFAADESLVRAESEAWERVAREILRKCFWRSAESGSERQPVAKARPGFSVTTSDLKQHFLEKCIVSQVSRPTPSGARAKLGVPCQLRRPSVGVAAVDVRLALGTCIFRRVIKVAGSGVPPMYLLLVVSQWHGALVVRCYDFVSGQSRQAESLDPGKDSALISEFEKLSRRERDMQVQVMLDDLVVFDDSENTSVKDHHAKHSEKHESSCDNSPVAWAVKFADGGAASIVIDDAGKDLYDAQVEEQMAAAAAQVEKRREETQRVQRAAREKDRRARAKKSKRDAKRREAQAKSRKIGAKGPRGASARKGRKTRKGGGADARVTKEGESDSDRSSDASSTGGVHGEEHE